MGWIWVKVRPEQVWEQLSVILTGVNLLPWFSFDGPMWRNGRFLFWNVPAGGFWGFQQEVLLLG